MYMTDRTFTSKDSDSCYQIGCFTLATSSHSATSRRDMSRQSSSMQSPYSYSHQHQLSRSAYPTFLSLQETIKLQLTWASRGVLEAFRWDVVVKTATRYLPFTYCLCILPSYTQFLGNLTAIVKFVQIFSSPYYSIRCP